jgi:predicted RNA-binding Zn ribbon-like protein
MEGVPTKRQLEYEFDLTGGILCLDFANTISRRENPEQTKEHLANYADLVAFARQSGIVSSQQANELCAYAERHANSALRTFHEAIALRETLYRAFTAIARDQPPAADDLRRIGDVALEALQHRCLARDQGGYRWEWQWDEKNSLERVLWPVAQSAADLLTSDKLRTVRLCEAPDCEWLFLDQSRNRSRRWCDMTSCGNRQKARRHYQRSHGSLGS